MQAIQTRYQHYLFRSRIEARWAAFFDAMGWPYHYEPEGFLLPNGRAYLPDFYLPGFDVWVEIKGAAPTMHEQQIARLCAQAGLRYYILYGPCDSARHGAVWFDDECGVIDCPTATFATCRRCQQGVWIRTDEQAHPWLPCPDPCTCERWPLPSDAISAAYNRAKAARFEHGQHP